VSEFDLIARYFTRPTRHTSLGIGDDAALIRPAAGVVHALTCDTLVAGVHFPLDAHPADIGHKALAVNLSDLAAMGAVPRWALLALTLPAADDTWLAAFSGGLFALADTHRVDLIGGDTTRGPLSMSLTLIGEVPPGMALTRNGARAGQDIWVSGELGAAAAGLAVHQGSVCCDAPHPLLERLHRPQPRVSLGVGLRRFASAAIDISDGLIADLGHLLAASRLGAVIETASLPRPAALTGHPRALEWMLTGGDDYELLFTADPAQRAAVLATAAQAGVAVTRIGDTRAEPGLHLQTPDGPLPDLPRPGYDHFR
jgi:thiamine-monophosphate kinase